MDYSYSNNTLFKRLSVQKSTLYSRLKWKKSKRIIAIILYSCPSLPSPLRLWINLVSPVRLLVRPALINNHWSLTFDLDCCRSNESQLRRAWLQCYWNRPKWRKWSTAGPGHSHQVGSGSYSRQCSRGGRYPGSKWRDTGASTFYYFILSIHSTIMQTTPLKLGQTHTQDNAAVADSGPIPTQDIKVRPFFY